MRRTLTALGLIGAAMAGANAHAATENLLVDNSTLATAQNVDPFALDGPLSTITVLGVRGSVFGGALVDDSLADYYSFTVAANQLLTISVVAPDGYLQTDDPLVGLYSTGGVQLANDDDNGAGYDALLTYTITTAGVYYVAVSGYADFDFNGIPDSDPQNEPLSTDFLYTLQITAAPVPVPGALVLLGSAMAGLAGLRRRA